MIMAMMIAMTIFQWILSTLIYLILLFIIVSLFFYFWNGPLPVNKNNPNLVILKVYGISFLRVFSKHRTIIPIE
jgi:hypothetical protein